MNKKINKFIIKAALLLVSLQFTWDKVHAQSGDQILDGIGETDLIARYIFNGDVRDWSRNNLHAIHKATKSGFIKDERFEKVLSLSGGKNEFITIPKEAFQNVESLSISAWVYLRTKQPGQYLFDLGTGEKNRIGVLPFGSGESESLQITMQTQNGKEKKLSAQELPTNIWVHLTIVFDVPSKSLTCFVDSKQVGKSIALDTELSEILGKENSRDLQFFIGRSLLSEANYLDVMLHDLRFYRVPLNSKQIAGIYFNAFRNVNVDVPTSKKAEDDLPVFSKNTAQLYNAFLQGVDNVEVETEVGNLPRLPTHVQGVYQNNLDGPRVRVIWPAPKDNNEVLQAGSYTITGMVPGTQLQPKAKVVVKESSKSAAPSLKLEPFALHQVSLDTDGDSHETKFMENRDKFVLTLAETDPNSFLYMFRHAFNQTQPEGAKPLGVWDSQETKLRGHATGHYLTAIAQAYAGTGYDKELQQNFLNKMNYMVNSLYELAQLSGKPNSGSVSHVADPTQVPRGPGKSEFDSDLSDEGIRSDYWNWGKGYISAYPPDQFIMLENGAKYGGQKNQIWAPYYTLHKILAGLIDVYKVSGNKKALEIAVGMGDWVYARLDALPQETLIKMWNTYIAGEFGGMNETMAALYDITKDPKYLKGAQLFDNIQMFFGDADHSHGLAKNVDTFRGLHANQHIPQIVGSLEMYKVSNKEDYFKVADNFWYKAVNDYMYSIGGVAGARNPANAECFVGEPATLYENGFSTGGQNETCATYNMLKLTGNLFLFDQRAEYMDYYERGLFNHILASVAEDSPANTYHVPLRPGSIKHFGNPKMTGFTCCNGTAIESSTKLQNSIYFKSLENDALFVNLFIPSTLNWEEKGITLKQTTNYPKEDHTTLTVSGNGKFDLHVRVPSWAQKGFFVTINGKDEKIEAKPGSYLKIKRNWKDGDTIELKMPFHFYLDPVMDQPNIASLFYGPVLLAAQETDARKEWRKVTLDAEDLGRSIKGDSKQLQFTIDDIVFKPFYETYGRHSVYLDVTLK
ncbi:Ig-like domain (group 4) [Aquiflexum balticum DSM 16537]|uniref:Ig-like domain (Group 4) n=1 Tax=Aquiflexum balticum DSM 16537 TaxID=758820 RepID=A0A1W2H9K1_9BACT|nr:beta-L-arabinofuranosidase domain-containing protein [Aquiflexum balticum]SMD45565.1 Ig-like domain (group 4) [Aquiflexum balticum DSM 16537]